MEERPLGGAKANLEKQERARTTPGLGGESTGHPTRIAGLTTRPALFTRERVFSNGPASPVQVADTTAG